MTRVRRDLRALPGGAGLHAPRQTLRLWTGKAAPHPLSIEARLAEANNDGYVGELFNCWRCRTTERKPEVDPKIKGRRRQAAAQADIDRKWAESIDRHEDGDCLRIRKPRTKPWRGMFGHPRCGAEHPDHPAITCTAHALDEQGRPKAHRGKHRAKLARGAVIRWTEPVDVDQAEAGAR